MGSPCEIVLRGEDTAFTRGILTLMLDEIQRLEAKYSRFLPDSVTTAINRSAGTGKALEVDEETAGLLDYADTCYRQSGGLFDITSGSLRALWNYRELSGRRQPPAQVEIAAALEKIGWDKAGWDSPMFSLPVGGMEIDFGGLVKEYAADCAASLAENKGAGPGMVELGGDIRLIGAGEEGQPWRLGIRDPARPRQAGATVALTRGALATSGDYERYTVIQGKRYSHILNPLTGWPVEGFSSVSVLADQCLIAGTAASIAVLHGEAGEQWLRELGLPYLCIDRAGNITGSIAVS